MPNPTCGPGSARGRPPATPHVPFGALLFLPWCTTCVAGFAFAGYAGALALLGLMVVAGTWIGSRILDGVSELWFTRLYKGVLTLIAARLVLWEGAALLGAR